MAVVDGLRGSAFSVYMGVQAERWGSRKKIHYGADGDDTEAGSSITATTTITAIP